MLQAYELVAALDFAEDPCNIGTYLKERLQRNEIMQIANCSRADLSPHLYALLQRCQGTSVAVERSFSLLKKFLRDDRNFNSNNVRKYITILYNSSNDDESDA